MSDTPEGFDADEDNVVAIRHPETLEPVVIPRELALEESRPYKAYRDHLGGLSWEVIATRHGYVDAAAAQADIRLYVASARSLYNSFTKHQARALQLAKLEMLQNAVWEAATGGNIPAVTQAHALIVSQIKLMKLDQLDEDDSDEGKVHTVIVGGTEDEYVQTLNDLD